MNRTIKEATVQRYHYDSHHQLRIHLSDFVAAYTATSSLPITSPNDSRLSAALPPTNSSADAGRKNRIDLLSTPSIKCRD
jgi:hypothetical protein